MSGMNGMVSRKVLLVEFNEITWRFIDPLCAKGRLPTFSEFMDQGTRGSPIAVEGPGSLDPWISWTTLYTGRPQEEHGVRFLEQPPETVTGPRIWEIAADAGKTLGIYGSIMSWPPRSDVRGFWVPSTFSPTPDTFPANLRPIQELNLTATRAHTPVADDQPRMSLASRAWQLCRLGLKPSTAAKAASFLVRSRLRPYRAWEKVSLQPVINLDFFSKLYRQHHPDFATFHSNHVAHYMHRYWRAADSTPFHVKATEEEIRRFGPAIEYGYRIADWLLKKMWKLVDDNTVVVLASGLGQQPYVVEEFKEGREIVRVRDIHQILELCGVTGHCTPLSMMAPQWNLKIPDAEKRAQAERTLKSAWYRSPETRLFAVETVGNTINFNVFQKNLRPLDLNAECVIPEAGGKRFTLNELCVVQDPTPKEGYHDPVGMTILRGAGVRKGARLNDCTNLDLAPTILHLMGLSIPSHMKGRVLEEAFESSPRITVPRSVGKMVAQEEEASV